MDERHLDPDPLAQFHRWFAAARDASIELAEAVALATVSADGRPAVRMVLLKGADERGFAFFSNYESRKGVELAASPRASLLAWWRELGRQVRVEGVVTRMGVAESEAYFRSRPVGSRLAALVSPQSRPLAREELDRRYAEARALYGDDVPLPPSWGGYLLDPDAYEFWQHGDDRLHDRFRYEPDGDSWSRVRLAP